MILRPATLLRRHWRWLLGVASIVGVVTAWTLSAPATYRSSGEVEVTAVDPSLDLRSAYYGGRIVPLRANPFIEVFSSTPMEAALRERLGREPVDDVNGPSATVVAGTDRISVRIAATAPDPRRAVERVDAAAAAFVEVGVEGRRSVQGLRPPALLAVVSEPASIPVEPAWPRPVPTLAVAFVAFCTVAAAVLMLLERRSRARRRCSANAP